MLGQRPLALVFVASLHSTPPPYLVTMNLALQFIIIVIVVCSMLLQQY